MKRYHDWPVKSCQQWAAIGKVQGDFQFFDPQTADINVVCWCPGPMQQSSFLVRNTSQFS